jgi:MazG family protein
MARLRGPGGCPWDAKQSLESLKPYLLEEAYEVLEAMEHDDTAAHREELGDLLLQIVFQAEIAQETGLFDMADIAQGLDAKLRRRHPDVFAPADTAHATDAAAPPADATAALARWERIKATERPKGRGRLSGVPQALPALLRAWRSAQKAHASDVPCPQLATTWDTLTTQLQALQHEASAPTHAGRTEQLTGAVGDVLFGLVAQCRSLDIDPEAALRRTVDRFQTDFAAREQALARAAAPSGQTALDPPGGV